MLGRAATAKPTNFHPLEVAPSGRNGKTRMHVPTFRRFLLPTTLAAALFAAGLPAAQAADLLPPERAIPEVVDHYVDARLQEKGVTPVGRAAEATLLRRLMLDLVGRIPTPVEVEQFTADDDPAKLRKWVDRLMASDGFVRHQTEELNTLLTYPAKNDLRNYLTKAVEENRPWDQIFRELMLVDGQAQAPEGAHEFLRAFVDDADQLTNEVSVRLFGINVSCAKCHDHPLVEAWTQHHFYGMKSFFNRTFENGGFIGEREYGLVSFQTVAGEKRDANLMFLTGEELVEPEQKEPTDKEKKEEKKRLDELKKKKQPPPPPKYSRRARIVEVGLAPGGREFFARAIVNRMFERFYGHGLVMPLDQMHEANDPSHPELLEWLARDFINHGYDLQRLMRGLLLSETYARDSRWTSEDRPPKNYFAVADVRPLTPMQLGASLKIATLDPQSLSGDMQREDFEQLVERTAQSGTGLARQFEMPRGNFEISVDEALFFSNNDRPQRELLRGGLVNRLQEIEDDAELIRTAYASVLLREPNVEEKKALLEYLAQRSDRREAACRQIAWALLTSTEFRFNY